MDSSPPSMATATNDKPVIVRVKRKASQSHLDAFWIEINERSLKRPLLDFGKLSISGSSSSRVEESKSQKIFVQHVETVTSSENTIDVLRSLMRNSADASGFKEIHEKRRMMGALNKQDQLLVKAKQMHEVLSSNARYEQIWRRRKGKENAPEDEALQSMCRLYDIVKVEQQASEVKEKYADLEDLRIMSQYLPLLRDVLPTAATEFENDFRSCISKQESSDDFVYDLYAVNGEANVMEADSSSQYPLVQVDNDDDYYDGPDDSENESYDSNAEDNPLNDYPEEESSMEDDETTSKSSAEDDDEATSKSSDENSEDESETEYGPDDWSDSADQYDILSDEDVEGMYGDDYGYDEWTERTWHDSLLASTGSSKLRYHLSSSS